MVIGPILLQRCKSVLKVCSIHIELLAVVNSVHTAASSLADVTCAYTEYRSRNWLFICIYLALGLWEVIVQKKEREKWKHQWRKATVRSQSWKSTAPFTCPSKPWQCDGQPACTIPGTWNRKPLDGTQPSSPSYYLHLTHLFTSPETLCGTKDLTVNKFHEKTRTNNSLVQLTLFTNTIQYFFKKAWLNSIFHGDFFQLVCWLEFIWWKWDWLVFIATEKR